MAVYGNVIFENVNIPQRFRNFAGKEKVHNGTIINPEGKRNFCVELDPETAMKMKEDGWNVKFPDPEKAIGDPGLPYLPVEVSFKNYPPLIVQETTTGGKSRLSESNIRNLDEAEIVSVDLIIRPYNYEVMGRTGVKAYCKEMWVTIEESIFAKKHGSIPDEVNTDDGFAEQEEDIPF